MKCVDYDTDFARNLATTAVGWVAPPKDKKKRKRAADPRHSTATASKQKGFAKLDSDAGFGFDHPPNRKREERVERVKDAAGTRGINARKATATKRKAVELDSAAGSDLDTGSDHAVPSPSTDIRRSARDRRSSISVVVLVDSNFVLHLASVKLKALNQNSWHLITYYLEELSAAALGTHADLVAF
ncbi:hypothetical protein C8Q80DRAFT_1269033 [Daedaleopsis nitida]|nr:hypothetical protein C8Q80DRAFT_1269033 [Daedaleopsis nitida]